MLKLYLIILLSLGSALFGQSFGQNKVQYREFDWDFISSPNFDVYYYGDEIDLATFTMEAANEAYEQIGKHLRWNLKKRVPIIVYHSHNEFQQNNAVGVYMSEGIGGVTELFKNRVVIPFEGDYKAFRHVIHHELVHAMINDLIYGGRMQNEVAKHNGIQVQSNPTQKKRLIVHTVRHGIMILTLMMEMNCMKLRIIMSSPKLIIYCNRRMILNRIGLVLRM